MEAAAGYLKALEPEQFALEYGARNTRRCKALFVIAGDEFRDDIGLRKHRQVRAFQSMAVLSVRNGRAAVK